MDLPLRVILAKHRENAACAGCHARFDSFGLAFESYGPVGELRAADLAGRAVDTRAEFPGGIEGAGVEDLKTYIRGRREADFIDNLCRKAFVYALGRGLLLSDEPALDRMRAAFVSGGHRFETLVRAIVTSPQFLNKRAPEPSD
jgi:hypothetical protein